MMSVLHTIVPLEQVFPAEPAAIEEQTIQGGILQGIRSENGFQVTRLISTDPKLYLNPSYQPGSGGAPTGDPGGARG